MKKILAVGDSFTTSNFESLPYPDYDVSYDKWPEIIGKELNHPVVNLAMSGVGNDFIATTALDQILAKPDRYSLVLIGTTDITRFMAYRYFNLHPIQTNIVLKQQDSTFSSKMADYQVAGLGLFEYLCDYAIHPHKGPILIHQMYREFILHILRIQNACKINNIPLIITSLILPLNYQIIRNVYHTDPPYSKEDMLKQFINVKEFYQVDPSNIIGWPFYPELGGYQITDSFTDNHRIGEHDAHPNKLGHELIAQQILKEL
jgi:hypothetical protein